MKIMMDCSDIFRNCRCPLRLDEPLAGHTSFRIGGPADVFAVPGSAEEAVGVLETARKANVPVFVIGGGANILVGDRGVRGLVVSLEKLDHCLLEEPVVRAGAGCPVSRAAEIAARAGLAGLERFYAMPGSVGGAVWMNARCYETEIADRLESVTVLDRDLEVRAAGVDKKMFSYKKSPYQAGGEIILEARFRLESDDAASLAVIMQKIRQDREEKGHFTAPSAGSVFKNNRAFGMPTGKLIDALGLKGTAVGGARISALHANIIINTGNATARDVKELISLIEKRIFDHYGFVLDREIIYIGED